MKEWHFSDGSYSTNKLNVISRQSMDGSSNLLSNTGRRINVTVVEGKDLISKERSGKCDYYVKLQYGKHFQKTRTAHAPNHIWNKRFEFDEIGDDDCLMIQCYTQETFGDENIGSARVNLEGLVEGSVRDTWIPLEKVNSGELRLQIEAMRVDHGEGSKGSSTGSGFGWIEVVLLEERDLIAADIRGTSDPYVKVHYGKVKKRTKGDFNNEHDEGWTQDIFESYIVKEREGKRPLLNGDLQVTLKQEVGTLGELTFTDNSSWIRSRKFKLGLKVASGYCEGIREAKTEAFTVKDHRGELYKKTLSTCAN